MDRGPETFLGSWCHGKVDSYKLSVGPPLKTQNAHMLGMEAMEGARRKIKTGLPGCTVCQVSDGVLANINEYNSLQVVWTMFYHQQLMVCPQDHHWKGWSGFYGFHCISCFERRKCAARICERELAGCVLCDIGTLWQASLENAC